MEIRIGDLAKRSGCEVVTIRYYEKEGLLPKPARSGGNFRLYGEAHAERLQFIRHCRSLDMTLSEIAGSARQPDAGLWGGQHAAGGPYSTGGNACVRAVAVKTALG